MFHEIDPRLILILTKSDNLELWVRVWRMRRQWSRSNHAPVGIYMVLQQLELSFQTFCHSNYDTIQCHEFRRSNHAPGVTSGSFWRFLAFFIDTSWKINRTRVRRLPVIVTRSENTPSIRKYGRGRCPYGAVQESFNLDVIQSYIRSDQFLDQSWNDLDGTSVGM